MAGSASSLRCSTTLVCITFWLESPTFGLMLLTNQTPNFRACCCEWDYCQVASNTADDLALLPPATLGNTVRWSYLRSGPLATQYVGHVSWRLPRLCTSIDYTTVCNSIFASAELVGCWLVSWHSHWLARRRWCDSEGSRNGWLKCRNSV
jgi:hypothetical protein